MNNTYEMISQAWPGGKFVVYWETDGIETEKLYIIDEEAGLGFLCRCDWHVIDDPEPSIGYDYSLLIEALQEGATHALTMHSETGVIYMSEIEKIIAYGIVHNSQHFIDESLVCLPLRYWNQMLEGGRLIEAELPPWPRKPLIVIPVSEEEVTW